MLPSNAYRFALRAALRRAQHRFDAEADRIERVTGTTGACGIFLRLFRPAEYRRRQAVVAEHLDRLRDEAAAFGAEEYLRLLDT